MEQIRDENSKSFPRVPGIHFISSMLVDRLKSGKPGDVITDEEMRELCGKDTRPGGDGYCYLATAIKICLKEHRVVWKRTRGAWCIKCLVLEELLLVAKTNSVRIHKTAKKSIETMQTVSLDVIPEVKRPEYLARMAQFGTIAAFTKKDTQEKMIARNICQPFDVQKMLEAMK